ncbi:MAG: DUF1549 domain-containing protein, partial [Verrucomicrobiota bacterium]
LFLLHPLAAEISFDRDIRPILSDKCFHCHGFDEAERKSGLRLDTREGAMADLGGYAALVPGKPNESELLLRIESEDPDEVMPPLDSHLSLSPTEIALLRTWISGEAQYEAHWAFQPLQHQKTPPGIHPIDHFLHQAQVREGLSPNPPAEGRTLARRLSLDLTGLPPLPERSLAFAQRYSSHPKSAVNAYLDELFASPHYGERMAWNWLEISRYADTNGYQGDQERQMWPWRDWVASAFQQNLSWDQFTIWQLAGDLLPSPTSEQILATGFSRNHPINAEGGRIPEENRVEYVFDMTETMGTTWLGLTLECSRCHDHKFDPLSQKDYFALNAFFNQTAVTGGDKSGTAAPHLSLPTTAQEAQSKLLNET